VGIASGSDRGGRRLRAAVPFLLLFSLHLAIALLYKTVFGLDIQSNPRSREWDWFWQAIPADLLRTQALTSIWHLHSQPPLFNAYGAIFFKLAPVRPLEWMHYGNIVLGSVMSGMMYSILYAFTRSRRVSIVAGVLLLLNPSVYLYESFILYDLLSAFLVVLSIYALARHRRSPTDSTLALFVLAVNLLALTRSLYHLIFVAAAVSLIAVAAGRHWKRCLIVSGLISCLSVGWFAKNYAMFGFFGSSSWMGANLWRVVSAGYASGALQELAAQGLVPHAVVDVPVFSPPSRYPDAGGADEAAAADVLSRDDRHNVRYVAISAMYLDAALRLLRHDPMHYVRNLGTAYAVFTEPSSDFVLLRFNASRIALHQRLGSDFVQGRALTRRVGLRGGPFVYFLLPLALAGYVVHAIAATGCRWRGLRDLLGRECVMAYTSLLLVYTATVSVLLEYGESERLKFIVEQPMWAFFLGMAHLSLHRLRRHRPGDVEPGPALVPRQG
jgi:hypothetical protein